MPTPASLTPNNHTHTPNNFLPVQRLARGRKRKLIEVVQVWPASMTQASHGLVLFLLCVAVQAAPPLQKAVHPTFSPAIPDVPISSIIVKRKQTAGSKANAGLTVVRLKAGTDPAKAVAAYKAQADVVYAEADSIVVPDVIPDDTNWGNLWGLAKINAPQAWDTTKGGASTTVCIVDSGVDYNHPDIKPNMDPRLGYNAITKTNDPMDDYKHGTHVAGIIGAVGNNNQGVVGVNWKVKLLACKFIDSNGYGLSSNAIACVNFCTASGAKIIQASWSGTGTYQQSMVDTLNAAAAAGVLFVGSAGNTATNLDVTPKYPASYNLPNQISVASVGSNVALSAFSNFGMQTVSIAAPGEGILSTIPGNQYESMSGTSMATPFVSGAAALVLGASAGSLTFAKLKQILLDSAARSPNLSYSIETGVLDVNAALDMYLNTTKSTICKTQPNVCSLKCNADSSCTWEPNAPPPPSPSPAAAGIPAACKSNPSSCQLMCNADNTCTWVTRVQAANLALPVPKKVARTSVCKKNPKKCVLKCNTSTNTCSWVLSPKALKLF